MTATIDDRRLDELDLQLKGLVHARALLEMRGASTAELAKYTREARRVRAQLVQLGATPEAA
jgi:hypothetical protein